MQFVASVRQAVDMWNAVEASIGVRYVGDCATARVTAGNRVNEIGWDDVRDAVTGTQAAVTQGVWATSFARRDFLEADIVIENKLSLPDACLRTVMAHELGHAIGFGHSDTRGDLMAPSFTTNDLSTCRPTASAAEMTWLASLYGVNRKPLLTSPADVSVIAGAPVSLTARASDPDGDAVTFEWKQIAGPAVGLTGSGATASFTAPESGPVTIEVTAVDGFLKRAASSVVVSVTPAVVRAVGVPPPTATASAGFRDGVAPAGVTLARWGGGTVTAALAAAPQVRSLWSLQGGVAVGFIAGAPDFVNQPFIALFPGGWMADGTMLAVVTGN